MDLLERLLGHDEWATSQLLDVSRDLTDAQLDQRFDIGHRTLRATLEHIIANIEGWTARMAGLQPGAWPDGIALSALMDRHEDAYAAFVAVARRMRDEDRLDDTFVDHFGERMSFAGAILHVVLHNAEHRTEALHILQRLGVPDLPEVDHGLWDLTARGA